MHNTLSEGLHKDIEYIISYLFLENPIITTNQISLIYKHITQS